VSISVASEKKRFFNLHSQRSWIFGFHSLRSWLFSFHSLRSCSFLLILFFVLTANAASPNAMLLTELNRFTTLSASFTETTLDASHHVLQSSNGVMMVLKPNYFRFETLKPTHQLIITNGKTLWVYDMDLQQATHQSLQNMPINPAKVLSGNNSALFSTFNISMTRKGNYAIYHLTPKKVTQSFRAIDIVFNAHVLQKMVVYTTLGQTSVFVFSNVKNNPSLDKTLFEFHPPTGVDILN